MKQRFLMAGLVALGSLLVSEAGAQPGGRGPGGGMGIGGLLMSEQVRGEIDLLEEQEQELRAIGEEIRGQMRDTFMAMRDLPREEREIEMRAQMEEIREQVTGRVKEVLMPQQFERLQQIELQQQMQRQGSAAAVSQGRIAEALGLSESQQQEMQQKAAEAQKTMEEKIRKAREEARDEILSVLTPEQRAKFDELVGKPFEMQQNNRFGRGGRGERGGPPRGGDRRSPRGSDRPELE